MGQWSDLCTRTVRRLTRHDAAYYAKLESDLYSILQQDIRRKVCSRASECGERGAQLSSILSDLMKHPLCKRLAFVPDLYFHRSPTATFSVFGNAIIVPTHELIREREGLRAALAHELGHLIANDYAPLQRARNPWLHLSQNMERRADLIAAHLCGDGGAALAKRFASDLRMIVELGPVLNQPQSWSERLVKKLDRCIDRRHPDLQSRVNYLNDWATRFLRGEPLPEPTLPVPMRHFGADAADNVGSPGVQRNRF